MIREIKTCRTCGARKKVTEFYTNNGRPCLDCKPCANHKRVAQLSPRKLRGRLRGSKSEDASLAKLSKAEAKEAAIMEAAFARLSAATREAMPLLRGMGE